MRWPRRAAPAARVDATLVPAGSDRAGSVPAGPERAGFVPAGLVHAGFLVTAITATVAYALAEPSARRTVYALVTAVPIITFLAALRRGHLPDRWPWRVAVVGLVLLALSNLLWPNWITDHHLGRAEGSPADLMVGTAHTALLVGAGWALRRHVANDSAGVMDAAMIGLCCGGPLWEWVVRPRLVPNVSLLGQAMLLIDLLVLSGVVGSLVRVGRTARKARGTITYMVLCALVTLAAIATAVLTVHGTALWTAEFMILGYLTLAAAPLHPGAPYCTLPQEPNPAGSHAANGHAVDDRPCLGWLGLALCVNPLIAAVQVLGERGGRGLMLPLGTLLIIPLVLLRFRRLSAERAAAERTLAYHASHDELTGLYNRRYIVAEIDRALAEIDRGERDGMAILLCDLDGFKPINDRLGHQAGDSVLQVVASRLTGCVRDGDVVGRLGGDEFLILCRDEPEQAVAQLRERIPPALEAPVRLPGAIVTVGVTMGWAVAGRGADRDTLIGAADTTMYAGKARQRRSAAGSRAGHVALEPTS